MISCKLGQKVVVILLANLWYNRMVGVPVACQRSSFEICLENPYIAPVYLMSKFSLR